MLNFMKISLLLLIITYMYLFTIRTHYLSSLLSLESMVLILLIFTIGLTTYLNESLSMFLFILTLSVCEAAIGLTLLVSFVKLKGNDLISSINSIK
uniref:NADH-ubiquinone oxidoreductase chain 4L n=1 Tax=Zaptyx thaumatopoma TaxID=1885792 RepID=A0A224A275_9EUPU|nr:NADH dehydrogenase subunit 4L [Zaptyx thaumatopoma]